MNVIFMMLGDQNVKKLEQMASCNKQTARANKVDAGNSPHHPRPVSGVYESGKATPLRAYSNAPNLMSQSNTNLS
jgi:hypothetical protein